MLSLKMLTAKFVQSSDAPLHVLYYHIGSDLIELSDSCLLFSIV